jgi:DNA-binding transcriptional LysR family regulator
LAYVGAHLPNTDCEMRIISEPEIVFAVSKKHPLCTKGSVSRDEFKEQTLIQREIGSETRNLMDTALGQNGYIPGRVAIFGSREGALQAAQEGLGLAPVSTDEIPENLQVAKIRAADFQIYGEIHAVCLKSRRDLPIIAEALEARA